MKVFEDLKNITNRLNAKEVWDLASLYKESYGILDNKNVDEFVIVQPNLNLNEYYICKSGDSNDSFEDNPLKYNSKKVLEAVFLLNRLSGLWVSSSYFDKRAYNEQIKKYQDLKNQLNSKEWKEYHKIKNADLNPILDVIQIKKVYGVYKNEDSSFSIRLFDHRLRYAESISSKNVAEILFLEILITEGFNYYFPSENRIKYLKSIMFGNISFWFRKFFRK